MATLSITRSSVGDQAVLALAGDLDLAAVEALRTHGRTALETDGCRRLTIDLAGLDFLDSSGLGVLVELRNLAKDRDSAFELIDVPSGATRVITIAGLAETFGVAADDGRGSH